MKVKELVHTFTLAPANARYVHFRVRLIARLIHGEENVCEDGYNECPYMFDDAKVSSWWLDDEDTVHITAYALD